VLCCCLAPLHSYRTCPPHHVCHSRFAYSHSPTLIHLLSFTFTHPSCASPHLYSLICTSFICTHFPPFVLTYILTCPSSCSCCPTLIGPCWWFLFLQRPAVVHLCCHTLFCAGPALVHEHPLFVLFGLCYLLQSLLSISNINLCLPFYSTSCCVFVC